MYRCPECGSTNLEVRVEVWATLIQTDDNIETDTTTPKNGDHDWGENNVMRCVDCDYDSPAAKFSDAVEEDAQHATS